MITGTGLKLQFARPKLKYYRKIILEHFWRKIAPPEFRLMKYRKNVFF